MKTIVTFEALADTRARDEDGVKIVVKKGKTFNTSGSYAKIYRGYKRLFKEVGISYADPKESKTTPKNSNAFPVAISNETTNAEIEAILTEMGAKFKKKGSRKELLEAFETRQAELNDEGRREREEKATEKFKAMIDNRTLDQLEDLVNDLDEATNVEGINKEVCRDYILEVYEAKKEENETSKEEDEDGNSEGTLDDDEVEEGALDTEDGGDLSKDDVK